MIRKDDWRKNRGDGLKGLICGTCMRNRSMMDGELVCEKCVASVTIVE